MKFKITKKEDKFKKIEINEIAAVFWGRILNTVFVLLVIGTFGAVFLFLYITNIFDKDLIDDEESKSLILDKKNLKEALSFSKEKKESLDFAKNNLPDIIDPSKTNGYSLGQ